MSASTGLDSARAIVVGGAGGIGSVIVRKLVAAGARVGVLDLTEPRGPLGEVHRGRIDLANATSIVAAFEAAVAALDGLDILVNAAGILRMASAIDTTAEDWDRVMSVNARGAFLVLQEAGRRMVETGHGSIISIASMAAKIGGEEEIAYAASKAAVVAMTRVAALEWGPLGVRVNCVCPGYIPTEMGADTRTPEDVVRWSALSPLGRLGEPEEVADVITFLASQDARYLTGQAINVTGGMVMH